MYLTVRGRNTCLSHQPRVLVARFRSIHVRVFGAVQLDPENLKLLSVSAQLKHNDWSLEIAGLVFCACIIGVGIGVMLRDRCIEEEDVRQYCEDVSALDVVLNLQAPSLGPSSPHRSQREGVYRLQAHAGLSYGPHRRIERFRLSAACPRP
jgi:hypothetical protein